MLAVKVPKTRLKYNPIAGLLMQLHKVSYSGDCS